MQKKILLIIFVLIFWIIWFFSKTIYCKFTKKTQIIDTKAANIPSNYLLKTEKYCIYK